MSANSLLRHLPKTDTLLDDPHIARWRGRLTRKNLTDVVREAIEHVRRQIIEEAITDEAEIYQQVCDAVDGISKRLIVPSLRRAINATGVILHTNIGRAPLSRDSLKAIEDALRQKRGFAVAVLQFRIDQDELIAAETGYGIGVPRMAF